jgi:DNA-binding NarL/FixJ family response regulator
VTRPRILLADDHAILLEAFKALLEPEFEVVGTVTDGRALLAEFSRLNPDVVLITSRCRSSTGWTPDDNSKRGSVRSN